MPMVEDLSLFFAADEFATAGTLDGNAVSVIFDDQTVDGLDVLTGQPSALVAASSGAERGQALAIGSSIYRVREVLAQPPDGATVRLMLSREA